MHVADQGELTRSILEASRLPRGTPWNYRETVKERLPTPSGGMVSECHFPKLKSGLWIHPKKGGGYLTTTSLGLVVIHAHGDSVVFKETSSLIP